MCFFYIGKFFKINWKKIFSESIFLFKCSIINKGERRWTQVLCMGFLKVWFYSYVGRNSFKNIAWQTFELSIGLCCFARRPWSSQEWDLWIIYTMNNSSLEDWYIRDTRSRLICNLKRSLRERGTISAHMRNTLYLKICRKYIVSIAKKDSNFTRG